MIRKFTALMSTIIVALLVAACGGTPATAPTEVTPEADAITGDATPMPSSNGLARGESRTIAMATDTVMMPTPRNLVEFNEAPVTLTFDEFYDGFHPRYGLQLSDKLVSLDGQQVVIDGYMAPPLKPALDWFVLTRVPLALCPFCSTDVDWPNDIALAYMPEGEDITATEYPLRLHGRLEVGSSADAETGMISLVRIYIEDIEQIRS